jgi:hypothetical protein
MSEAIEVQQGVLLKFIAAMLPLLPMFAACADTEAVPGI